MNELTTKTVVTDPVKLIQDVLNASTHPMRGEVWKGPRSNEVGFTLPDGSHIVLAVRRNI